MPAQDFVHLHVHSHYSLLDGACPIDALVDAAAKQKMSALALTDHGNMFGVIDFYQECLRKGVKPIIGYETYLAPRGISVTEGVEGDSYYHLTLLVRNERGYKNLIRLATIAYVDGFYRKPRLDKTIIAEHADGLVALSGCLKSELSQLLLQDNYQKAKAAAGEYRDIFGNDRFFIELQDNDLPEQKKVLEQSIRLAGELGIPPVATNDIHYLRKEDAKAHDVLLCINTGKLFSDTNRMRFATEEFYFKSREEMGSVFRHCPDALRNTFRVAELCHLMLSFDERHIPRFVAEDGSSNEALLRKLCHEGIKRTYPDAPPEVMERIETELEIIERTGYVSYFLMAWDCVRYAKEHSIPSGLRGSGVSSLVAHALGLTDVDPLKHELLFRRFLDVDRREPPDIDIDLCEAGRAQVINYVKKRYGEENTAQIITFGTMAARAAVRDVGRVLNIPLSEVDAIAKKIPPTIGIKLKDVLEREPELRDRYTNDPTVKELFNISMRLEGLCRHASTHAAGLVISDKPLYEYVPLYRSGDDIMTQFAMNEVAQIGLLKIDFLGLRTLTVIQRAEELIKETEGKDVDVTRIPLDDKKTYELLGRGETKGVFQLSSAGMRELLQRLKPDRIEEIIAVVALYRPGPLNAGMVDDYIKRKQGIEKASYVTDTLEPMLRGTYGVVVYQEQVMRILSEVGGLSMTEAYTLIKAISKKTGDIVTQRQEQFIKGAMERGSSEDAAEQIFDWIEQFAKYGFNKAHATAYAYIAYQTAYLKANYPTQFMAALLTCEKSHSTKVVDYIDECRRMGIEIIPPSVNEGETDFTVARENQIRFGLGAIKNIGEKAIDVVVKARQEVGPFKSLFHFCENVDLTSVNRAVIEALIKSGSMDCLPGHRAQLMAALDRALHVGSRYQDDRRKGQKSFFGALAPAGDGDGEGELLPDVEEWPENELLAREREMLGFYMTSHPLTRYRKELENFSTANTQSLPKAADGQLVVIGGMILSVKRTLMKNGIPMARFVIEDLHGTCRAIIFKDYARFRDQIQPDKIVFVRGRADLRLEEPYLQVSEVIPIEQAMEKLTREVRITLPIAGAEEGKLRSLRDIFAAHRGSCRVLFCLETDKKRVFLETASSLRVAASREFASKVERLLGAGHISFVAGNGQDFAA